MQNDRQQLQPSALSRLKIGMGRRQSLGIEIVEEGGCIPRYYPPLRQLNRESFRASPIPIFKRDRALVQLDGCRLQDCVFENCKLVGVNFAKCEKLFLSLKFSKCLIDTCNFSDLDLKGIPFLDCHIRNTHFTQTNLSEAFFTGSDLQGSLFHNADLRKANFRGAVNYSINPLTNKLLKAKFSRPEVMTLLDHLEILID